MKPTLHKTVGSDELALIHMLQLGEDPAHLVETVDSIDPRYPRRDKAVIIISTQFGCPVGCLMCDASGEFSGNLSTEQLLAQVRFVMARRPENLGSAKLKVHFARMGEPSLNPAVIEALRRLPAEVPCPGLIPCISSVAPRAGRAFFADLLEVQEQYAPGCFQLQFSINSTDPAVRRRLMPISLLDLEELATIGRPFHRPGDRKVVLNFALGREIPLEASALSARFDPGHFMVKLTPINPTENAEGNGLKSVLSAGASSAAAEVVARLGEAGFDTVVSIGESEEIEIGSNCGQLVRARREQRLTTPLTPPPSQGEAQDAVGRH